MSTSPLKLGIKDLVYSVVAPTVVALLIMAVGMSPATSFVGLKYTLLEAIVVVSVPMLFGLLWNRWAGGCSGFLLGSLYALYFSDQVYAVQGRGDISLLGVVVSAMLIGYVTGALNKRSTEYKRMALSAVTAAVIGAAIVTYADQYSIQLGELKSATVFLTLFTRVLCGLIVPFIARVFISYSSKSDREKSLQPPTNAMQGNSD